MPDDFCWEWRTELCLLIRGRLVDESDLKVISRDWRKRLRPEEIERGEEEEQLREGVPS